MTFRLIGLLLLATAVGILWYGKPAAGGGHLRYPKKYKPYFDSIGALIAAVLLGVGLSLVILGTPTYSV